MSGDYTSRVMQFLASAPSRKGPQLTPPDRALLMVLAYLVGPEGWTKLPNRVYCRLTGLHVSTVQRSLRQLVSAGLVEISAYSSPGDRLPLSRRLITLKLALPESPPVLLPVTEIEGALSSGDGGRCIDGVKDRAW